MSCFALYRLPHEQQYHRLVQHNDNALQLPSVAEVAQCRGFVLAPFEVSAQQPVVVIRPDEETVHEVPATADAGWGNVTALDAEGEQQRYGIDFRNFHGQLCQGTFKKIVLARCSEMEAEQEGSIEALFVKACHAYPRLFVALVSAPQCGTWLMATPEILLQGDGNEWHTMALAGTMKLSGAATDFDTPGGHTQATDIVWSEKNRFEQRFVADYIEECIEQFTPSFTVTDPYTVRAGNLVHLRTDFHFTLPHASSLGGLINALHPTPAVCGMPKADTFRFISNNESQPRHYYSGFAGVMNANGPTHLFVSLRCMRIEGRHFWLYAGGGLLPDSREEDEWNETEAKMETMRGVF